MIVDNEGEASEPGRRDPVPRTVADVMCSPAVRISAEAAVKDVVRLLADARIDAVTVVAADAVVGVISASDLLSQVSETHPTRHRAGRRRQEHRPVKAWELMSSPAVTTTPDTSLESAARQLAGAGVHMLPVVDAESRLLGVVTRRDVAKAFLRPDADIERDIAVSLVRPVVLSGEGELSVVVRDGVVTLSGSTVSGGVARRLLTSVSAVPGVLDVRVDLDYESGLASALGLGHR